MHWPLARRLMRLATTIVVPSDYLVDVFAALRTARHAHSQRGRNRIASSIATRPRPRPVFLHNRGLATEYNPACTLRAFAIIQQRYPEARLTIAHDGPLRAHARSSGPIARACVKHNSSVLFRPRTWQRCMTPPTSIS